MNPRSNRYVICPTCQALNGRFETSCEQCGVPIPERAPLDSIAMTHAPDLTQSSAPPPRSRPLLLIGLWMIFLPNFVASVEGAIFLARHRHLDGLAEFIIFWGFVGMGTLSFVVLYWATKNHFKPPRVSSPTVREDNLGQSGQH